MILVIGWTVLRGPEAGLVWALIGGICLDIVSGAPFGVFTLAMVLTALAAGLFHGRIFGSSVVLPLGLAFPLSLLFNGIILLLLNLFGRPIDWLDAFSNVLLPAALYNTGLMMIIFPLLYLLNRWLNPQPLSI